MEEKTDNDDEGARSSGETEQQQRRLSFRSDVSDQAEESTSEAHAPAAKAAAAPAAVLTLQAGNVRISYNPASSSGVRCSVTPRDGQRKPVRQRMHRARRQGVSSSGTAGMPSDDAASTAAEEWRDADGAAAADLSAGGIHVLRAPGCTLRLHT